MNIVTDSGQSSPLKKEIITLNSSQRLQFGLKGAGLYLGLAVISIFIPVFHFVLVPLFLILSTIAGLSRYRKTKFIDLSGVSCPACRRPLKESALYFRDEPSRLYCYDCRSQVRVLQLP